MTGVKKHPCKYCFYTQDLAGSENFLKIENEKLKEVSDIARNQIELFESRKQAENTELKSLREEVLDLQTVSDEKALIGRLHRQIIAMQMKESDFAQREKTTDVSILYNNVVRVLKNRLKYDLKSNQIIAKNVI
jgi:hypothetical protein